MSFSVVCRKIILAGILAVFFAFPVISYATDTTETRQLIEKRDAAIQASGIDERKKEGVMAIYHKYDAIKEEIQRERANIYEEIKKLVDAGKVTKKPDEEAISAQLNKLDSNKSRWQKTQKSQVAELRAILKPSEEAELALIIKNKKNANGSGK